MQIGKIRYRFFSCALLALSLAGCQQKAPAGARNTAGPQATAPAVAPVMPAHPAPTPTPAQPAATPEQQRVRVLIQQVEDAYARGQADYHKGLLLEAKQDFDRAVDLMLTSGIDIKSDAQLQEEFDRVVDGVSALEMEALKQGNGFVPREEPTPAEAAEDVTFVVDPNLVAKARADLATTNSDLPLVVNDYVATYINFFANTKKGHYTLLHSFERAGRYRTMIQRVMAEEGVPQDLIYLAVAESGFNPRAQNPHSHAGGMWQFMPYGNYGLTRNAYVDERFDPEKSTRAYARYMKFIYNQTGDWYLSMAGYNWGTGNVQRAVQKTGYADFWELYRRHELPVETQSYVPEILAAIIIANHPTQYGFDDVTFDPPVLTDTVTINYPVDLRLVSDLVAAPVDQLMALNPSLLRLVTPPDTSFDLHLPGGMAAVFEQRIAAVPEAKRNAWRYHRVAPEDSLASVAREYHVTVEALAAANQLGSADSIAGAEALVVPVAPAAPPAAHTRLYTVRKGETLVTVSDRFGVSLNQLRRWNNIAGIKVQPGSRLHVADPASAPRSASRRHHAGGSKLTVDERSSAPAKDAGAKSVTPSVRKKGAASTAKHGSAKHSGAAAGTKGSGTHGARKHSVKKPVAHSKSHASK